MEEDLLEPRRVGDHRGAHVLQLGHLHPADQHPRLHEGGPQVQHQGRECQNQVGGKTNDHLIVTLLSDSLQSVLTVKRQVEKKLSNED